MERSEIKLNDKILLFDIELTKALYFAFPSHKPQRLSRPNKHIDQFMMSAAWMWYPTDRRKKGTVESIAVTDDKEAFKADPRNDYHVVKTLRDVVAEADIVVGHNSDNFDLKELNYRCLKHGLDPIGDKVSLDTLKKARQVFRNDSLALDSIASDLGQHTKYVFTDKNKAWNLATLGDEKAIEEIRKYNEQDIYVQKGVFDYTLPFFKNIPKLYTFKGANAEHEGICPRCGSTNCQKRGTRVNNARTVEKHRYQCQTCRFWFTGKINLLSKSYQQALRAAICRGA